MPYRIDFTRRAEQDLGKLGKGNRAAGLQVAAVIADLADDPKPAGAKKLASGGDFYRVRSGDYRIIYKIEEEEVVVLVVKIGDRKEVYRYLKRLT